MEITPAPNNLESGSFGALLFFSFSSLFFHPFFFSIPAPFFDTQSANRIGSRRCESRQHAENREIIVARGTLSGTDYKSRLTSAWSSRKRADGNL